MKKKLVVLVIFLAFLILNVVGFLGYHALSNETPKAEAFWYWFSRAEECDEFCGGATVEQWETCMAICIFEL